MDAVILLVMALAMIGALVVGYLFGSKPIKQLRVDIETAKHVHEQLRGDGDQWRIKFNEAIVNLAAERKTAERVEAADAELKAERERAGALAARVAAFERGEQERQRAHETQLAQLKDLEPKLEAKFGELAG